MFTWEASPACKKAIKYLDGKRAGRSSVPCIFIGGQYCGGFDGGVGEESPGILEMAFKGTLRQKLDDVGALK